MTTRISTCMGVCLILLTCSAASAGDYYVSPTGDDANPGTIEAPFRTLAAARQALRQAECRHQTTVHLLAGREKREVAKDYICALSNATKCCHSL